MCLFPASVPVCWAWRTGCCWSSCSYKSLYPSWSGTRSFAVAWTDWPPPPGCWKTAAPQYTHPDLQLEEGQEEDPGYSWVLRQKIWRLKCELISPATQRQMLHSHRLLNSNACPTLKQLHCYYTSCISLTTTLFMYNWRETARLKTLSILAHCSSLGLECSSLQTCHGLSELLYDQGELCVFTLIAVIAICHLREFYTNMTVHSEFVDVGAVMWLCTLSAAEERRLETADFFLPPSWMQSSLSTAVTENSW